MVLPAADGENHNYPHHKVSHFRQRFHWDCGVSCVLMLLDPEPKDHFLENFQQICAEEGFGESTWTIDLCYLLKRFDIKHEMYTSMPGVNDDYKDHNYYNKIIDIDRPRVSRRFASAAACGISVHTQVLSARRLLEHLRTGAGPAILLVDAGVLACCLCKHNKLKSEFRSCFGGSYKGHYILVVGFTRTKVLYRDPSLTARVCATSHTNLHRAATAVGTDDDVILITR